ncbi:hypothetical protein [Actinoalloteichus hymeniacidonis]|uniref:Excreted virulence factor EspC, type VII ESX diderm n=1 Tax=Actinoalloteichus hymeniacidonis TaxID=340345 RepID=A0AAC9N0U9_9PSEU|nr:hypothetical protein [Actinoalloteichus hymeniacidonis]AOS65760.1 hypothetical protein TL08_24910 [Actinoalloteichus hymeniacidonis]MBB5906150.1 hypothetical protein [Actinoalloteichus hymeniacidonis]
MSGYQTILDELIAIGGRIEAESVKIDDQTGEAATSNLDPSDFGGEKYTDFGNTYLSNLDANLVKTIQEYARSARALADNIKESYRTYAAMEDEEAARMQGLG